MKKIVNVIKVWLMWLYSELKETSQNAPRETRW
jgi:hypothetical protein